MKLYLNLDVALECRIFGHATPLTSQHADRLRVQAETAGGAAAVAAQDKLDTLAEGNREFEQTWRNQFQRGAEFWAEARGYEGITFDKAEQPKTTEMSEDELETYMDDVQRATLAGERAVTIRCSPVNGAVIHP